MTNSVVEAPRWVRAVRIRVPVASNRRRSKDSIPTLSAHARDCLSAMVNKFSDRPGRYRHHSLLV